MSPSPTLQVNVLGQSLIQHDLGAHPWPDFVALAALFAHADACFTNLETAIRSPVAEMPTREGVYLHAADPRVLDCLQELSASLLATANNHVWDLGSGGIVGMLAELDARGFTHSGAGKRLAAAAAPAYRRTANGTVALVAMASGAVRAGAAATTTRAGVNELRLAADGKPETADLARIFGAIAEAVERAEIVLACHHNHILEDGGRRTPEWLCDFARRCIDAGASLYVGHGAPRLHGIEIYRSRPIFYDLGNFIFQTATEDGFYDAAVWQSVVAECRFARGRLRDLRLTPLQLNAQGVGGPGDLRTRGRPSIARGPAADAILDRLAELSRPFGTVLERADASATIRAG